MSDEHAPFKLVQPPDTNDARVNYARKARELGSPCPHKNQSLDDKSRTVWCEDCGCTLDLFDAFSRLLTLVETVKKDREAMAEFYSEKKAYQRKELDLHMQKVRTRAMLFYERLRNVGVVVTEDNNGLGCSFEYPKGWVSLKHAEKTLKRTG